MAEPVLASSTSQNLHRYLLLSKSAKGAACVALIKEILAAPGIYVFAELIDMPNVMELKSHKEYGAYFRLLNLFANGTYQDYKREAQDFPQLSEPQLKKLRFLSIVTLSATSRTIPYQTLMTELDISSIRELEDLIIDAIYNNIIKGKLDQCKRQLDIEFAMSRDIREDDLVQMLAVLTNWTNNTASALQSIDSHLLQIHQTLLSTKVQQEQFDAELERKRKEAKPIKKDKSVDMNERDMQIAYALSMSMGEDMMEIEQDESKENMKGRNSKRDAPLRQQIAPSGTSYTS